MPDLSVEAHWACDDVVYFQTTIKGSQDYTVYCDRGKWHCDCKGFKFRGTCKHVKEAQKKQCTWRADLDGGEPVDVPVSDAFPNGKSCPQCGGAVTAIRIGV